MDTLKSKKFSTGWLIVVACMLIQAIPFGVASNIQPQFVSYVVQEKGFTLAGFSLIFTLGTIASAIASPFIGVLFNKISTKLLYILGCILSGGGFLAFSMCNQLWQFYIVAAVVQVGTAVISSIGVPLLINSWFDEETKGKAMGIAFAGSGLGNIFLQQLVASSLATNGASKSYLLFGALSLIVGVPVSLFFLGMYVSALAVQYPAYLKTHAGFSASMVGTVGSVFALFCLGGNLFGGVIFDKLGTTKGLVVAFILAAVSCVSLMFAKQVAFLAFVFATLKGLSVFAYMIGPSMLTGSFFGQKDFGAILGVVQIFFAVGFAAGSSVFGLLVDSMGYGVAWIFVLVFIVICYGALIVSSIGMNKLNKKRIAELNESEKTA